MARDRTLADPLASRLRTSWLAVADLGTYVAAALRRPDLVGRMLDIGGPQILDGPELALELSRALGHELRYFALPPQVFEEGLIPRVRTGRGPRHRAQLPLFAEHADTALLAGKDADLEGGLSRPLTTPAAWARGQVWSADAA